FGPPPTLTNLSLTAAPEGTGSITLTLNGTNFAPNSMAQWNGTNLATGLFPGDTGEVFQELIRAVTRLQIIRQSADRDTSSDKDGCLVSKGSTGRNRPGFGPPACVGPRLSAPPSSRPS